MAVKLFTLLIASMCLTARAELPVGLKLCKYGELECIKATINSIFKDNLEGFPSFNPLNFGSVHIQQGENSAVSLDLELKNSNLHGINTASVLKVKGFGKDLSAKHGLHLHSDYLSTVGDYDVNGKILILPIEGSGKSNITMVDVDLYLSFAGVPVEKAGATYIHIENINVSVKPKKMIYKVENLFNGDKALSDNMNLFLNENWQEIFNEVHDSLSTAYGRVFKAVINGVFSKHPYNKYFSE